MHDKNDENPDDEEPGFMINLPFGLGWLRGDRDHLSLLMPIIRWIVLCSAMSYLVIRVLQEMKS